MEKVISCFKPRPEAACRLVCFPWAGGGSAHYARWGNVLSSSIEVLSVRLPGRESRARERFFLSMQQVVDEVVGALLPRLKEKPFALFGHSFGAFVGLAVAEALKRLHNLEAAHIFLSGASPPYAESRLAAPRRSRLPEADFLEWLSAIGGTPPELLASLELLELFLPALRADLQVAESYSFGPPERPLLSCPVTCFDGEDDAPHDLQAWQRLTCGGFSVRMLPGSHFYLKEPTNQALLLEHISGQLQAPEGGGV